MAAACSNKFYFFSSCFPYYNATLKPRTIRATLYITHRFASYSAKSKKTTKWFSTTYTPRFNWAKEKPSVNELDTGITPTNQLYLQERLSKVDTSPVITPPIDRNPFKSRTKRTGLLAIKIGVVPQWTVQGKKILCTMLQVIDNHVLDYRTPEMFDKMTTVPPWLKKTGLGMHVVGAITSSPLDFSEQYLRLFEKSGLPPKRHLTRFFVTPDAALPVGTQLNAQHFKVGDYIDCHARTIEMGFQGVLVRWGMKGGRATHGVTKSHRRIGSIGGGGDKGGIWKGKKMPGHMGSRWRYLRAMQIVRINTQHNVIFVRGQNIPGPPHAIVRLIDTIIPPKRALLLDNQPAMPTFLPEDISEDCPEDFCHSSLHDFNQQSIDYAGMDPDKLFLHSKKYILYGGTIDGKNRTRRKTIR